MAKTKKTPVVKTWIQQLEDARLSGERKRKAQKTKKPSTWRDVERIAQKDYGLSFEGVRVGMQELGRQRMVAAGKLVRGNRPSRFLLMSDGKVISKTGSLAGARVDKERAKRFGYKRLTITDTRRAKSVK